MGCGHLGLTRDDLFSEPASLTEMVSPVSAEVRAVAEAFAGATDQSGGSALEPSLAAQIGASLAISLLGVDRALKFAQAWNALSEGEDQSVPSGSSDESSQTDSAIERVEPDSSRQLESRASGYRGGSAGWDTGGGDAGAGHGYAGSDSGGGGSAGSDSGSGRSGGSDSGSGGSGTGDSGTSDGSGSDATGPPPDWQDIATDTKVDILMSTVMGLPYTGGDLKAVFDATPLKVGRGWEVFLDADYNPTENEVAHNHLIF